MFGEDESRLVAIPDGHDAREVMDAISDMDGEIMKVMCCHIDFTELFFAGLGSVMVITRDILKPVLDGVAKRVMNQGMVSPVVQIDVGNAMGGIELHG